MRKKKLLITMLLGMLLLLAVKTETLAAEERTYFIVKSGTATKIGTEQVEQVKEGTYLDEWQVQQNCILSESVANVLLKSSNAKELSLDSKLDYAALKELAGAEVDEIIYQGYAQLKLKNAHDGYTFGILCQENEDKLKVTGYFAEIKNKGIYKLDLVCEKIIKEEFISIYCKPQVKEVDTVEYIYSNDSEPEYSPTPNPTPEPDSTPEPPSNAPITIPSVPVPVIPGA